MDFEHWYRKSGEGGGAGVFDKVKQIYISYISFHG